MDDSTYLGRYRLLELLGAGGMGQVFRAYDTATQRVVALKVLPAHMAADTDFQERFRREALAAARLNDPHVVPIHGFGEIEGRLYVDMRLIDGRDVGALLEQVGRFEPARAVFIVEQLAGALDAAHRAGLVHRDVKPSNILVADNDFVYLIDFGIARAVEETGLTGTGQTLGTLAYMAPERFTSAVVDPRSDVYSVAIGMAKDPALRYQSAPALAAAARAAITAGGPPGQFGAATSAWVPSTSPWAQAAASAPTQLGPQWHQVGGPVPVVPQQPVGARRKRRTVLMASVAMVIVLVAAGIAGVVWATQRSGAAGESQSSAALAPSAEPAGPYGAPIVLPFGRLPEVPKGVAVDAEGNVYITLVNMGQILKLPAGANTPSLVPADGVEFGWGIAVDTANRVYVANGDPRTGFGGVVRLGGAEVEKLPFTGLPTPIGVAVDPAGSVYAADQSTNQVVMLKASSDAQVQLPFQNIRVPSNIAVDQKGNVYLTQATVGVLKLTANSAHQEVLPFQGLDTAMGIAVDTKGSVFVSDYVAGKVLKLDTNTKEQTELPFTDLVKPAALAVDDDGNVYVTDERDRVLKLPAQ